MWQETTQALERSFVCKDFKSAFAFMTEVAFFAEQQHHHPEWSNVYNRVHIRLSTHDAGNVVTEKDRVLAAAIDQVFEKYDPLWRS